MQNLVIITLAIVSIMSILSSVYKDKMYRSLIREYTEERKDLLNRIMARNLTEYKNTSNNNLPKGNNVLKNKILENEFQGLYRE